MTRFRRRCARLRRPPACLLPLARRAPPRPLRRRRKTLAGTTLTRPCLATLRHFRRLARLPPPPWACRRRRGSGATSRTRTTCLRCRSRLTCRLPSRGRRPQRRRRRRAAGRRRSCRRWGRQSRRRRRRMRQRGGRIGGCRGVGCRGRRRRGQVPRQRRRRLFRMHFCCFAIGQCFCFVIHTTFW